MAQILGQDPVHNPDLARKEGREGGGAGVRCERGHTFNRARQGYLHLGTGRKLPEGDTAEMVAARMAFLEAGHYEPLREAIAQATPPKAGLIVDVGAGPGYYLAGALRQAPQASGLAIDVSKAALKRVKHERAEAVLADAWSGLPIQDATVDVLLNVFAPRNGDEFRRVLSPRGRLIVATPNPDHLKELRMAYGLLDVDPAKEERLAQTLKAFEAEQSRDLSWPLDLDESEVDALIRMGPNAFHGATATAAMRTTASVKVTTYVERSISSHPSGGS
jgi:23S rRNA (guanine745-N1)-methyltransferase